MSTKIRARQRCTVVAVVISVVSWLALVIVSDTVPLSVYSPALPQYIQLQNALDEYLQAAKSNSFSREEKATATFQELSKLADILQSHIPTYLHQSLPYAVYLTSISHTRTWNNQYAPKRPNTPAEIHNTTEKWMCTHLVDQITSLVDRLHTLQFLQSPEYDGSHLDDIERDMLYHVDTIFQHTRLDIIMMTDKPTLYLDTFEKLYATCVTKHLMASSR